MKKVLLITWSIIFVLYVAYAATGHKPSWVFVFCPLACYLAELIGEVFFSDRGDD